MAWGIVGEMFLVILNVPSYISQFLNPPFRELYLPLPFLLLIGFLITRVFLPFLPSTPWETQNQTDITHESPIAG